MRRPGRVLALEASAPLGSVAVALDGVVAARAFLVEAGAHAARLVPTIAEVLTVAGIDRGALEGIVVGRGPGSFTGVRVAAATARGLATGLGIPLWARSSLAAAALSDGVALPDGAGDAEGAGAPAVGIPEDPHPRCVLFDARGDRLYAACHRVSEDRFETLMPPAATTLGAILEMTHPPGTRFCGSGALRHAEALRDAGFEVLAPPVGHPTADGLLRLHALLATDPAEPVGSRWEPEYLRGSWDPPGAPRSP